VVAPDSLLDPDREHTMHEATRVVVGGDAVRERGAPHRHGPAFASVFHAPGDPAESPFVYGRHDNPTWQAFERAVGDLEGGPALCFASGMAAVSAVMGVALRPGDVLVIADDTYHTSRALAAGYLAGMGIEVRLASLRRPADDLQGARLLWFESPSNPGLEVYDVAALAAEAHRRGALVAVDNTMATPLAQQPLALGADFCVASDTKALSGHSDLLLGHVAARDAEWIERLRLWRTRTGGIPGPMEVWLAHRALATLDVRLERMCANALRIASFLASRPEVRGVRYPGLPDDPAHGLAKRQMRRFGSVIAFDLGSREAAERFLAACTLIGEATSFGGVHSSAERRARWSGDAVPEGFIRLSVGIEHADDLLDDLRQALAAAAGVGTSASTDPIR
jgi:cystathionine gamma-lyase